MNKGPYGVPDPHAAATMDVGNPNRSGTQFKTAQVYSADTNQSGNFVFDTKSLSPEKPLGISKNTFTSVYGARAGDTLTNPSGRP